MEPVLCQADNSGRIRASVFMCLLHDSLDVDDAWDRVKNLFLNKQQIMCGGILPVRADLSFYPFHVDPPDDHIGAYVLFFLKKYTSDVRMRIYPGQLSMWRGDIGDETPM